MNSNASVGTAAKGGADTIDYTVGSKPACRAATINGFVRRAGKYLIDETGAEWFVKGGGIDCGSLAGKAEANSRFCNESLYKAHAELGCNTIRLTFNWEIFVTDRSSAQFKEHGFEWLKQNVEWARKYNIRLILNMHRIPCGDEAVGNVHPPIIFWNKTYQQQWKAVWQEIARRFADEPVILAYSMWNEQNAPLVGEGQADSEKAYGDLYQECIDAIRTVDTRHMIVCEQIFAQQNQDGGYRHTNFPAFPPLKEQNLMYEYHCYEPMEFTYQDKTDHQQKFPIRWDDPAVISGAGLYVHKHNQSAVPVICETINDRWTTVESDLFTADNKAVAGSPLFFFDGTAADGEALVFQWVEIWDVTDNERIYRCDFDCFNSTKTYFSYEANRRSFDDGLCFTNMNGYTMIQNDRVEIIGLQDGHTYKVTAAVRGKDLSADSTLNVGMRFWGSNEGRALRNNMEALLVYHKPYAEYRDKNNIPVFCGEWGAYYDAYSDGNNAKQWAEETLLMFKQYQMGFTLHTPFAMYSKMIQPWHYVNGTPTWGGSEYTILEDAFREIMPTI